ncbi:ERV/ALR sulfhydryl oxidase domain-containing protein [Lyophyllum atratum]|nr:ERV/ALR sulfhydryl oxidase domain-containing protein [Lyophyllum atratum]
MPPGMVMGPDGKPCKICTAFRHWRPGTASGTKANEKGRKGGQRSTAAMMAALASGTAPSPSTAAAAVRADEPPPNCPPDVEQLGRATWTFLHTTAAYYPERPTLAHRSHMLMLLRSLPVLYPCTNCAEDFGEDMKVHPPDVSSRVGLSQWLCQRHNEVNEKLGKERFDCAKTDERWKDGPPDGSCG